MAIRKAWMIATVGATWVTLGAPARAEEGGEEHMRLPVSFVERGITNPRAILSPGVDFDIDRAPAALPTGSATVEVGATISAGYSITDDLGVRVTAATLHLTNPIYYAGVGGGATFRFLKGEFEMGVAVDGLVLPANPDDTGAPTLGLVTPSVPMFLHFGKRARLDITPGAPLIFGGGAVGVGLSVPVQFAIDILEPLHVGVRSGVTMLFNPCAGQAGACTASVGDTFAIPVGFFGGYAIAGREGPLLDIDPFFTWGRFDLPGAGLFHPGAQGGAPATDSGDYTIGLELTGYLYL